MTSEPLGKVIRSRRRNETGFRVPAHTSSGAAKVLALDGEKKRGGRSRLKVLGGLVFPGRLRKRFPGDRFSSVACFRLIGEGGGGSRREYAELSRFWSVGVRGQRRGY